MRLSQEQFEKTYESNLKDNLTAGGKKYLFRKINQVESDNSFETIKKQALGNGGCRPKSHTLSLLPSLIHFLSELNFLLRRIVMNASPNLTIQQPQFI